MDCLRKQLKKLRIPEFQQEAIELEVIKDFQTIIEDIQLEIDSITIGGYVPYNKVTEVLSKYTSGRFIPIYTEHE